MMLFRCYTMKMAICYYRGLWMLELVLKFVYKIDGAESAIPLQALNYLIPHVWDRWSDANEMFYLATNNVLKRHHVKNSFSSFVNWSMIYIVLFV